MNSYKRPQDQRILTGVDSRSSYYKIHKQPKTLGFEECRSKSSKSGPHFFANVDAYDTALRLTLTESFVVLVKISVDNTVVKLLKVRIL